MRRRIFFINFVLIFTFMIIDLGAAYAENLMGEHFKTKEQCLKCHTNRTLSVTRGNQKISLYADVYQINASVHAEYGCVVCHQFGEEHVYGKDLTNRISKKCANCHTGAAFDYNRGIHNDINDKEKPNCVDCHGGHSIKAVLDVDSLVSGSKIATTCAEKCHPNQYEQFRESFHGKAVALGAKTAPDCSTCHGSHQILSKTNPIDKTHVDNKKFLCGECHEGQALGVGTIEHYEAKPEGYGKPMYYVKTKMPWLIIVVMSVFLIHIILDLLHRIRSRLS